MNETPKNIKASHLDTCDSSLKTPCLTFSGSDLSVGQIKLPNTQSSTLANTMTTHRISISSNKIHTVHTFVYILSILQYLVKIHLVIKITDFSMPARKLWVYEKSSVKVYSFIKNNDHTV